MPEEYRDEVQKITDSTYCDCCQNERSEDDLYPCNTCDNMVCDNCLDISICTVCQNRDESEDE